MKALPLTTLLLPALLAWCALATAQDDAPVIDGQWRINEELSDSTDKQVERALRAAGERVRSSWFDRRKDRYRGGPADQELYDRLSYDPVLTITAIEDGYDFEYADGYSRPVYTDNRSRAVSLTALDSVEDFSLGHWENSRFLVEAHPRDGGHVNETYTLLEGGTRLQVELIARPGTFSEDIELKRVYDKQP